MGLTIAAVMLGALVLGSRVSRNGPGHNCGVGRRSAKPLYLKVGFWRYGLGTHLLRVGLGDADAGAGAVLRRTGADQERARHDHAERHDL